MKYITFILMFAAGLAIGVAGTMQSDNYITLQEQNQRQADAWNQGAFYVDGVWITTITDIALRHNLQQSTLVGCVRFANDVLQVTTNQAVARSQGRAIGQEGVQLSEEASASVVKALLQN